MSPDQLAKNNTESGHQKAFFAWCAVARLHGFVAANHAGSYTSPGWHGESQPVEALKWIHSIPNGGARDLATAARMKAEGTKRGIPDIFLPFPSGNFHGLYIELKSPIKFAISKEQKEFGEYANKVGYAFEICKGWLDAVAKLRYYFSHQ